MKLENIKVGNIYKDYPALCAELGVKPKKGGSRTYHLIDLERYFKWIKDGNKFVINYVFEDVINKVDNRGKHNQLPFIEEMELLLIDMMIKNKDMVISDSKLKFELCLFNPNYHKYFTDRDKLSKILNMDIDCVMDFYDTTNDTFKNAIEKVIRNLENKKLMLHQHIYMITHISIPDVKDLSNMFDYDPVTGLYKGKELKPVLTYRKATQEESEAILGIERRTLVDDFNCDNVGQVIRKGLANQYYNKVNTLVLNHLNIVKYYQANKFIYNIEELAKQKYRVLNEHKVKEIQDLLNLKVMIRIDKNATDRYRKAIEKLEDYDKYTYRLDDSYVDNMNTISNNLIDIHNVDGLIN